MSARLRNPGTLLSPKALGISAGDLASGCSVLQPNNAYRDEMLVRFEGDDGSKWYERRVALVVGEGAYRNEAVPALRNPPNDAATMARALRALGFETDVGPYGQELMDAAYAQLTDGLKRQVEKNRIRYWEVDPADLQ